MTDTATLFPYGFARRHGVALDKGKLWMKAGSDPKILIEIRRWLGRSFDLEQVDGDQFEQILSDSYAASGEAVAMAAGSLGEGNGLDLLALSLHGSADLLDTEEDAPAIRLINGIIADAVRSGVSDIHFEPYETGLVVRMRIDGELREKLRLPAAVAPVVVSRIKVMARLDIAERRVPQDGRIGLTLGGRMLDVRVSTLPSRGGERVVLRILDKASVAGGLNELGMSDDARTLLEKILREPNGIVLVTGPTGSGKTTTLYAALRTLNDGKRNILTVEDPVEYAIDGIGQTQVDPKVGLSFAAGLRAILRQDPDVVLVGEIRDRETAEIAVQASLTGHLVLATVHTNDAPGAITRMRDMKVEPFLLASTLRAVIAQRLVRRLCLACRKVAGEGGFEPVGCAECGQSGYKGRTGLFEIIRVDDGIRQLIADGDDELKIAARAFANSPTMAQAAQELVTAGITSRAEAMRVTRLDPDNG